AGQARGRQLRGERGVPPPPLAGEGWGGGEFTHGNLISRILMHAPPPPPPPQRGGGQTEPAPPAPSLAPQTPPPHLPSPPPEPGQRVGGEAPARVARGDRRLRALDPSLGGHARLRWKLRQLRETAGNIAAQNFRLAAGKNRGRVAARRLVDAADADQFFRVHL